MSSRGTQRPSAPPHADRADDADREDDAADPLDPPGRASERYRPEFDDRPSLERILPELLKRGLEVGRGARGMVGESFLPRELAQSLVSQLGDVRSGVVKAVAHEVGRFLREADIASEMRKVLVGLDVEASVRLRFNQREDGTLEPDVSVGEVEPTRRGGAPPRPSARSGVRPNADAAPDDEESD